MPAPVQIRIQPETIDFLSSRQGTQHLPGGGYAPLQAGIHFAPGTPDVSAIAQARLDEYSMSYLTGSDVSASLRRMSLGGLLLPPLRITDSEPTDYREGGVTA